MGSFLNRELFPSQKWSQNGAKMDLKCAQNDQKLIRVEKVAVDIIIFEKFNFHPECYVFVSTRQNQVGSYQSHGV